MSSAGINNGKQWLEPTAGLRDSERHVLSRLVDMIKMLYKYSLENSGSLQLHVLTLFAGPRRTPTFTFLA
jgi:hypothetical protein